MHRVPAHSFQRLIDPAVLWRAWLNCRRGKRRQPAMAAFDIDADRHIFALHRQLRDGHYRPRPYHLKIVQDPKTRLIAAPAIIDRVLQRALIDTIGPSYERSFIDHHYACCSGRGPHRAVLKFLSWNRRYRYRVMMDIGRYFASIDRRVLLSLFARRLFDQKTLALIEQLLAHGGRVYQSDTARRIVGFEQMPVAENCGMPLGGYLSHWCGAFYLDGFDHFIKRQLKIPAYLRYMDDFTIFGNDPQQLDAQWQAIREWLWQHRRLCLKSSEFRCQPTRQAVTFLGFRVSHGGLNIGPKAKRRLKKRLGQRDTIDPLALSRHLQAYRGALLSFT